MAKALLRMCRLHKPASKNWRHVWLALTLAHLTAMPAFCVHFASARSAWLNAGTECDTNGQVLRVDKRPFASSSKISLPFSKSVKTANTVVQPLRHVGPLPPHSWLHTRSEKDIWNSPSADRTKSSSTGANRACQQVRRAVAASRAAASPVVS